MRIISTLTLILTLTLLGSTLSAQSIDPLATYRDWNVPRWALEALGGQFRAQYEWYDLVNPFYQRGDFDGDRQVDLALIIRHRPTGKVGIAVVHRATRVVHIVGAGTPLGNGGDNFTWLGAWRVEDGLALNEIQDFRAEVLQVEKPESAGGLIYWDGKKHQWVQRGD